MSDPASDSRPPFAEDPDELRSRPPRLRTVRGAWWHRQLQTGQSRCARGRRSPAGRNRAPRATRMDRTTAADNGSSREAADVGLVRPRRFRLAASSGHRVQQVATSQRSRHLVEVGGEAGERGGDRRAADWRSMRRCDGGRLERRQPRYGGSCRIPVGGPVGRGAAQPRTLRQSAPQRLGLDRRKRIADDQHAIDGAKEGDMAGGVPGASRSTAIVPDREASRRRAVRTVGPCYNAPFVGTGVPGGTAGRPPRPNRAAGTSAAR